MKITIYELLKLIKEGKAPKKIKVTGTIYYFNENYEMYLTKEENENYEVALGGMDIDINLIANAFNEVVELIEEEKEIEKFDPCLGGIMGFDSVTNIFANYRDKINELIDVINEMRDKEC